MNALSMLWNQLIKKLRPPQSGELGRRESQKNLSDYVWFHSIRLDDGRITPGIKSPELMDKEFAEAFAGIDLNGLSVLDVGAWNGAFSIEAKRRGASRVVALDSYTWNHPHFQGRATFDLATRLCNMQFEAVDLDLDSPQLSLAHLGTFDVVLFLGVFYHLIDPIAALREVAALASKVLVIETYLAETADSKPAMVFYPGHELDNDATNWWGPNRACMEGLLRLNNFGRIEFTETHVNPSRIRPGEMQVARGVFRAYHADSTHPPAARFPG